MANPHYTSSDKHLREILENARVIHVDADHRVLAGRRLRLLTDELEADWIEPVESAERALRIPPFSRERVEFCDFRRVEGGA